MDDNFQLSKKYPFTKLEATSLLQAIESMDDMVAEQWVYHDDQLIFKLPKMAK